MSTASQWGKRSMTTTGGGIRGAGQFRMNLAICGCLLAAAAIVAIINLPLASIFCLPAIYFGNRTLSAARTQGRRVLADVLLLVAFVAALITFSLAAKGILLGVESYSGFDMRPGDHPRKPYLDLER